eukprot:455265-Alexandrium_andersonii.AAC.1
MLQPVASPGSPGPAPRATGPSSPQPNARRRSMHSHPVLSCPAPRAPGALAAALLARPLLCSTHF